ncbi:hypothetical protein KCU89_g17654, partial [Aureobasidium melanogenum]
MQHSSNPASPTRSRSPSPLRDSSSSVTDTRDTSPSPDNKDAPLRKDSGSDKNEATFFQHITYPVSYTFSGLLRRLSADEAPT